MKNQLVFLTFTFILSSLPALCNEEVIKSFTTEEKLPEQNAYIKLSPRDYRKFLREKKKKGGKGLTDTFQISIFNLNPSTGIFNYTATNLRTGISQSTSVGLLDYDAVHFTLGTTNIPDSFGKALIHALDCTGFLNSDRTLSGVCSTIGQETTGPNLVQVAQPFNAVPN